MRSVPIAVRDHGAPGRACPFVGREAEIQLVVRHARRRRAEGPGIVLVTGAPGMGRTALLGRLADELDDHLITGLVTGAGPRPGTGPYSLVNRLIADLHEQGAAANVTACTDDEPPHTAGQRLLTALSAASAARPVAVVVDDVHAVDVESSLAIGFAARRLYGQQVLFLLSAPSADDSGPAPNLRRIMPARGDLLTVRLGGLAADEIATLGPLLGVSPLGATDARLIREHCDGNPRYVVRLLDEMSGDPHARSGRQPHVLRSFAAATIEQVGGLAPASRALLWALAVLDERCPLSTAARVAEVGQPLHALEPLLAAGLVEWWPAEPTTPVCISTPLLRQAAYSTIEPGACRRLHRRAADVLPFDRALVHRLRAAQGNPDPKLADDLTAAAWRWTAEGNLARAAQYLRWAAEVTEPGELHDRRLLFGVSLLQRGGRYDAAAALRERARRCQPSPLRDCVLGRFAMVDGDTDRALGLLESAIGQLHDSAPDFRAVAAIGYTWLSLLHGCLGDSAMAREAAGRCLALSPFGRRFDHGTELLYLMACCELDGPVAALRRLAELVDLPTSATDVHPAESVLLILRGLFRLMTGEPAEAVADIEVGLGTSQFAEIDDIDDWAHLWAATAHTVLGSWDKAYEHARAAEDIAAADNRPHLPTMIALTAFVEVRLGSLNDGAEHAAAAAELAESTGTPPDYLPPLATAVVAMAKGDPLGAVEALRPMTAVTTGWVRTYNWMWWPTYVDALIELGRIDDAEAGLAAMAAEIAAGYRVLVVAHRYLTGRALEATGDHDAALAAYQDVLNTPNALGSREWRAKAADAHYRLSRDRGPARVAPFSARLTEREAIIATLIADGLTNKAVGSYLGVTEKTVEAHLTRLYRKLSVKSRGELRSVLGRCARSSNQQHRKPSGGDAYRGAIGG